MSEPIYLLDPYQKELETEVESIKDGKFVTLKQNIFYPESGGQPYDTGKLIRLSDNREFPVIYVGKFSGKISHEIENGQDLKQGDKVKAIIDWPRRYTFMRYHTAAHIVDIILFNETNAEVTGNQIGLDRTRIDFNLENFEREKFPQYQVKINEIIQKNLPIIFHLLPREEAEKKVERFNTLKIGFPEDIKKVRLVEIGDFDIQACGGCHVKNTSEIGKVKFIKFDNKGKNNRRVYFTLE